MKKILIGILLLFTTSLIFGQIGFMGKRNFLSTDIFNAFYRGKYNLSYQYCFGNSFMAKASFSKYGKTYEVFDVKNESYFDETLNYNLTIDRSDISFNGFSWEAGFNLGYYPFTGMPMPIGYYMGLSFEHLSGDMVEKCRVSSNHVVIMNDKRFKYKNKAGIVKITYGRNSIIKKNLVLNTSLQLGFVFGNIVNPTATFMSKEPELFLPKSMPFEDKSNLDYDYFNPEKYKYTNFYIMPEISLGYMF